MAPSADTYTAAQAAQILGVSERRVRQLVNEGKLTGNRDNNGQVRVAQRSVTEERKRRRKRVDGASRRGPASAPPATPRPSLDVEELASAVANAVGQRLEGQLELTRRAESLIRSELDEERARRIEAEAKLAAATARVAELEAALAKRRGFLRRRA
ncbi:MAG TPA: helix-turn-helix domain-containing protein [Acidimicrobiales bacterium]|nr:helix-turn-helix domain-containing protein [Acidimicrobiales bacterium]